MFFFFFNTMSFTVLLYMFVYTLILYGMFAEIKIHTYRVRLVIPCCKSVPKCHGCLKLVD